MCNLRRLQQAGHRPIAVAGGGTGFVGDPGGKSEERSLLSEEELGANLEGIRGQLERFIDFGGDDGSTGALLVEQRRLAPAHVALRVPAGCGQALHRQPDGGQGLGEVAPRRGPIRASPTPSSATCSCRPTTSSTCSTPSAAGCSSAAATSGGTSPWESTWSARSATQEVWGLTTPLVLKADGTKFGKTESGHRVARRRAGPAPTSSTSSSSAARTPWSGAYLRYFTFLHHESILALDDATRRAPGAPRGAARAGPRGVHPGPREPPRPARAEQAPRPSSARRSAGLDERTLLDVFADAPSTNLARTRLGGEGPTLVDLLVETGLVRSKSRARTTVEQGGAYVNNAARPTRAPGHRARGPDRRPLPGPPAGQARLPPGPVRLTRPAGPPGRAGGGGRAAGPVRTLSA